MIKTQLKNDIAEYVSVLENNSSIIRKLKNTTVLVTGATGQIGSYLSKLLLELSEKNQLNISIIGTGRNRKKYMEVFEDYQEYDISFIEWDIQEPLSEKYIEKLSNVNYVVDAASNANPDLYSRFPVETMKTNFLGLSNLFSTLESATNKPEITFVSTGEIYGNITNDSTIKEEDYGYIDILNVRSCYPVSKIATETLAISYADEYGYSCKIARLSHIFGPIENTNRVVDYMLVSGVKGNDIILNTSGKQKRSYTYVGDACLAIIYISLFGESSNAYNVSSDDVKSIYELGEIIAKYCSISIKRLNQPETDLRERIILDNSKLKLLGWVPQKKLSDGLIKSINIMRNF